MKSLEREMIQCSFSKLSVCIRESLHVFPNNGLRHLLNQALNLCAWGQWQMTGAPQQHTAYSMCKPYSASEESGRFHCGPKPMETFEFNSVRHFVSSAGCVTCERVPLFVFSMLRERRCATLQKLQVFSVALCNCARSTVGLLTQTPRTDPR